MRTKIVCHPERREGSGRWRVQKLIWSRAHGGRAPAPRGDRSLFGVARAMRALPLLAARGVGASAQRLRLHIDTKRAERASLVASLFGMTLYCAIRCRSAVSPFGGTLRGRKFHSKNVQVRLHES